MKRLCDKCDRNFYHECDEVCKEEEAYRKGIKDGKAEAIEMCKQILHDTYKYNEYCDDECDDATCCDSCLYACLEEKLNELKEKSNG